MELKQIELTDLAVRCNLLIVPYGIETFSVGVIANHYNLLIVPYGIETR